MSLRRQRSLHPTAEAAAAVAGAAGGAGINGVVDEVRAARAARSTRSAVGASRPWDGADPSVRSGRPVSLDRRS